MASALKPYAELKVKVREYVDDDGKTKGVYVKVGTLFSTPHGSNLAVKLEAMPISMFKKEKGQEEGEHVPFNGWCNVFKLDNADQEISTPTQEEDFTV